VDRGLGEGSFGGQLVGGCVSGCVVKCFDCGSPLGGRGEKGIEVLIKQKLEQLSKITVSRRSSSEVCRRTGEHCRESSKGMSIGSAKRGKSRFSGRAKGTHQKMPKKNDSGRSKAKI
jgi:hypothetical protein